MERLNDFTILQREEQKLSRLRNMLRSSVRKGAFYNDFIDSVKDWELSRYFKDIKQKLIIKLTVLYNFEHHKDFLNLDFYRDLSCYSSLMAYYNICVSEVEAMRGHEIIASLTMFEFVTAERMAYRGFTSEEILKLEKEIYQGIYDDTKIYKDLVFQRFEEAVSKTYKCTKKENINPVKDKMESILYLTEIVFKRSRKLRAKFKIKYKCPYLTSAIIDWETNRRFDGSSCKVLMRYLVLVFFDNGWLDDILNLSSCKDFMCYTSLLIYYRNCLSQVTAMEADVSDSVSVRDLLVDQSLSVRVERSTDDNSLRLEQLFKKTLSGKYTRYTDIIADTLTRSFIVNKIIDMHIFALIETGSEARTTKMVLDKVAAPEVMKYLCATDLLNVAIAFSVEHKKSVVDEQIFGNKRQINEPHCSFKHLKCF